MSASKIDYDVAIVGYGPTGVSAANFLGALGVKTIVLERDHDIYPRARAVTVNDWTLRCFQSVGLLEPLLAVIDPMLECRWVTYDGRQLLRMKTVDSEMALPSASMIYQPALEQVLRDGVKRFEDHVHVRFGAEVGSVSRNDGATELLYKDLQSLQTHTLRCRYVLACDGGASQIRQQLGIELLGSTVETQWVVIDTKVKKWWPNRHLLTFWSDKKRPVVDIPLALGNHRWEFPLAAHESPKVFETREQLWALLQTMGITPEHIDIHQHAFYRHHSRMAQRWRDGSVFLLGDAAHLMPPWAGSGMQSGIRDAFNLCWKLHAVLKQRLPETVLDSYEVERAPNVAEVTEVSERLGRIIKQQMSVRDWMDVLHREAARRLGLPGPKEPLAGLPHIEHGWLTGGRKNSALGEMLPQCTVALASGQKGRLDDFLGADFAVLAVNCNVREILSPAQQQVWLGLGAKFINLYDAHLKTQADGDLVDLQGQLSAWMQKHGTCCVVVRPDRFVVAAQGVSLDSPSNKLDALLTQNELGKAYA